MGVYYVGYSVDVIDGTMPVVDAIDGIVRALCYTQVVSGTNFKCAFNRTVSLFYFYMKWLEI